MDNLTWRSEDNVFVNYEWTFQLHVDCKDKYNTEYNRLCYVKYQVIMSWNFPFQNLSESRVIGMVVEQILKSYDEILLANSINLDVKQLTDLSTFFLLI